MSTGPRSRFDRLLDPTSSKLALAFILWTILPSVPVRHLVTDAEPFTTYHAPLAILAYPRIVPYLETSILPLLSIVVAYALASVIVGAWHRIPRERFHALRDELQPTRARVVVWGLGTLSAVALLGEQVLFTELGGRSGMGPMATNLRLTAERLILALFPFSAVTYFVLAPFSIVIALGFWFLMQPLEGDPPLFFMGSGTMSAVEGAVLLVLLAVEWYLLAAAVTYLWDELWVKPRAQGHDGSEGVEP